MADRTFIERFCAERSLPAPDYLTDDDVDQLSGISDLIEEGGNVMLAGMLLSELAHRKFYNERVREHG